jgi:TolB-like protein/DNA-binding winged helix-turn-helix (wHTH) protein
VGADSASGAKTIRFGEHFELDVQIGKLYRDRRPVRLERIPVEILVFLIDQRGELVTREQIVERIWGKNAFLDTDNSINGAIRKIRQVLRDDPANPAFIQTISGKGYRFIAPVMMALPNPPPRPDPIPDREPPHPEAAGDVPIATIESHKPTTARRWWAFVAIPIIVIAALGGYLWRRSEPQQPAVGRVMLAVLPFANLTGDPAEDYFSDGLTEEMITQVGNLDPQRFGVIARTSVMHYSKTATPLAQIVRELGVQYVLEGSVRRDDRMLRITAQLIQTKDETHLWAREYDRELTDVLAVQGDIAQQIAAETDRVLGGSKGAVRAAAQSVLSPDEFEAYDLYLKGLYFFNKRDVSSLEQAISQFELAIAKDPRYARAYAGLADSLMLLSAYSLTPQGDVVARARSARSARWRSTARFQAHGTGAGRPEL